MRNSGLGQQLSNILNILGCTQISPSSMLVYSFHLFSHDLVALSLTSNLHSREDKKVPPLLVVMSGEKSVTRNPQLIFHLPEL